jgi:outer membrane protein TolC
MEFGVAATGNQVRVIYPDIPDNYRARIDLQWPLYTGGRLAALEEAALSERAALASDLESSRADVRLEITRAYWALVTATESLRVMDDALARTRAHLEDARNRLDAGLVPPNDVLAAEAQESRQRMLRIQAQAARDNVAEDLARLVGAPPGTLVVPLSPLESPPAEDRRAEALAAAARERRPERAALLRRIEGAGHRGEAAAAGRKPTVGVGGGVDYARPNPRIFPRAAPWEESWDASVNVSWPLFDGGRATADVAEASAAERAARARLAEFDARLAVEIRQRLSDLEASGAAIAAARDAVTAAREAQRVAGERFAAGVATSTDVLDAQLAVLQAELDLTQAVASQRLADARLARALGR